ncbi:MAG: type II toxin-antitoxin system HicA family toxin [Minisyncoccia bacterium]|jgi:predicted RNA binding protein YcfA (HicA-like mRNA interferase family)
MSKLLSSREVTVILLREGFVFISQKGSHAKYRKMGDIVATVIVPMRKKEIPAGTLDSIIRQSRLPKKNFSNEYRTGPEILRDQGLVGDKDAPTSLGRRRSGAGPQCRA